MQSVDIAIPTFNCAQWLGKCLLSVTKQSIDGMRIILRDDASQDGTRDLLDAWESRLLANIQIIEDSRGNLGMNGNYSAVLGATSAPLVMLTDPDDVWLPGKLEVSLAAMRRAEEQFGANAPILVCTDAQVVDVTGKMISDSYRSWVRNDPGGLNDFGKMISECAALTSTIMVNRSLLDRALPIPKEACPDWWLALVACAFGRVVYLPEQTVLYRRHPSNDSLAPIGGQGMGRVIGSGKARERVRFLIHQRAGQARAFYERFGSEIPREHAAALQAAATFESDSWMGKRYKIVRYGLWFASPMKNAGLFLLA